MHGERLKCLMYLKVLATNETLKTAKLVQYTVKGEKKSESITLEELHGKKKV